MQVIQMIAFGLLCVVGVRLTLLAVYPRRVGLDLRRALLAAYLGTGCTVLGALGVLGWGERSSALVIVGSGMLLVGVLAHSRIRVASAAER